METCPRETVGTETVSIYGGAYRRCPTKRWKALVQQHHPFFIKCNACILHGGRCNRDVDPLIRLPRASFGDPSDLAEPECKKRVQQCVHAMAAAINDANFYCTNYSAKEQPHIEGLFESFATALDALEAHVPDGTNQTDHAKRFFFRMMCVTNRGLHKGMPEMVAYLFNKKIFLCSREFKPLLLRPLKRKVLDLRRRFPDALPSGAADDVVDDQFTIHTLPGEAAKVLRNTHLDYALRPVQLTDFPLYFFISGTSVLHRAQAPGYRFLDAREDVALTCSQHFAPHTCCCI